MGEETLSVTTMLPVQDRGTRVLRLGKAERLRGAFGGCIPVMQCKKIGIYLPSKVPY